MASVPRERSSLHRDARIVKCPVLFVRFTLAIVELKDALKHPLVGIDCATLHGNMGLSSLSERAPRCTSPLPRSARARGAWWRAFAPRPPLW